MSTPEILLLASTIAFVTATIAMIYRDSRYTGGKWQISAAVGVIFLAFSLFVVAEEGLLGFWPVHTFDFWGSQVWIDLLISLSIIWFLILPRAKQYKMNTGAWLLLVCCSGSIGMLAMLARLIYLENQTTESR